MVISRTEIVEETGSSKAATEGEHADHHSKFGSVAEDSEGKIDLAKRKLELDRLTVDLEDAVATINSSAWTFKNRKMMTVSGVEVTGGIRQKLAKAVSFLQATEEAVREILKHGGECDELVSKVDIRVDRAVAALRPAAVSDFRSLLASIDWPPSLSSGGLDVPEKLGKSPNPLLNMHADVRSKFEQSFMALSTLQAVQMGRKARQLSQYPAAKVGQQMDKGMREPLWAIDELVGPMALKFEYHFVKWIKKPELVFALIHRVSEEYVDFVDQDLQPMLDKTKFPGCRARAEWISAMVTVGVNHLRTHALPAILADLEYDDGPAAALWLHTVDQTMSFDGKMQSLASRSFGLFEMPDRELSGLAEKALGIGVACVSVFAERPDWLDIWASLELADALKKFRFLLQKEEAWEVATNLHTAKALGGTGFQTFMLSPAAECSAPSGADILMSSMSQVIDRCRTLLETDQQLTFVRVAAAPLAHEYLDYLQRRCREAEGLTALAQEDAMVKVAVCTNAAQYCNMALQDWGDDIFFLELRMAQVQNLREGGGLANAGKLRDVEGSIFDEEQERFTHFRNEWIGKLVGAITRGFDARSRDYFRNRRRWQEGAENPVDAGCIQEPLALRQRSGADINALGPSSTLIDALAVLQSQVMALQKAFDPANFLEFWRNLAAALDQLLFFNVALGGAKFSEHGGQQFAADVQALFKIFRPFCARPGSYFKNLSDGVKLLTISEQDTVTLLRTMHASAWEIEDDTETEVKDAMEACLKKFGVRKLACATSGKVLNNRVFLRT